MHAHHVRSRRRPALQGSQGRPSRACKSLDTEGLETELGVADQHPARNDGHQTVDCPEDVTAESGSEFECTGTVPEPPGPSRSR